MESPLSKSMQGVNSYGRELTPQDISNKEHRRFVGGLWDEIGQLQFEFLKARGLRPDHKLLDMGCGCLRGGIHFVRYLDPGNYCGLDINASLIQAGALELDEAGLDDRHARLLIDDEFRCDTFNEKFDFMVSVSLFTHLPINSIVRCLSEARRQLKPEGVYFSTYFEAPHPAYLEKLHHQPGAAVTNYDSDPYHLSFEEISWMAQSAGLTARRIGDWNHPRNQKMAVFSLP